MKETAIGMLLLMLNLTLPHVCSHLYCKNAKVDATLAFFSKAANTCSHLCCELPRALSLSTAHNMCSMLHLLHALPGM